MVNSIWEQMAGRYDTEDRVGIARIIVQAVRAELGDTGEKTAMDYGCGTGLVGLGVADRFKSMLFVDPAPGMIAQVRRKIEAAPIPHVDTWCRDFMEEGPGEGRVDYVIMSQVLLHIRDSRRILRMLHTVLRDDGHLLLVDFDKNAEITSDLVHPGFERDELTALLGEVGFSVVHARTFHHGQRIFMNRDASMFIIHAVK